MLCTDNRRAHNMQRHSIGLFSNHHGIPVFPPLTRRTAGRKIPGICIKIQQSANTSKMKSLTTLLVLVTLGSLSAYEYLPKFSEECDDWAERDGECANNPSFMWSKCLRSCIDHSSDVDDQCESWADEGECTNNPNYIHIHCPKSCKLAIAWSPWVRNNLGKL